MPLYNCTLTELPAVTPGVILQNGKKLEQALKYMHEKKWVHLDVKASNVFVDGVGKCSYVYLG